MVKGHFVKTLVTLAVLFGTQISNAQDINELMHTSGKLILSMYDDQETMGKNICTDAIARGDIDRSQQKIDSAAATMSEMKQLDSAKDAAKIQDLSKTIKTLSDELHGMLSKYDQTTKCS